MQEKLNHHSMSETIKFTVSYPDHPPRKETELFRESRSSLVKEFGCFVCGQKSDLEAHHYFVEDAAKLGVDWIKFGKLSCNLYNPQSGLNINNFNWEEVEKNPDLFTSSKFNLVILCSTHHRHKEFGIHNLPFPVWQLQAYQKDGFEFLS